MKLSFLSILAIATIAVAVAVPAPTHIGQVNHVTLRDAAGELVCSLKCPEGQHCGQCVGMCGIRYCTFRQCCKKNGRGSIDDAVVDAVEVAIEASPAPTPAAPVNDITLRDIELSSNQPFANRCPRRCPPGQECFVCHWSPYPITCCRSPSASDDTVAIEASAVPASVDPVTYTGPRDVELSSDQSVHYCPCAPGEICVDCGGSPLSPFPNKCCKKIPASDHASVAANSAATIDASPVPTPVDSVQ